MQLDYIGGINYMAYMLLPSHSGSLKASLINHGIFHDASSDSFQIQSSRQPFPLIRVGMQNVNTLTLTVLGIHGITQEF